MSYKDLPLDQRMELASQYALLLVADNKTTEEIIGILKSDYALTQEQATQAFEAMRSDYKAEYNSTVRSNILKALGATAVCFFAFPFYYFWGKEMGSWGILPMIFAILFGIGGVGALIMTGRIICEKFSNPAKSPIPGTTGRKLDEIDKVILILVFSSFMLLCVSAYNYFSQAGIIDVNNITTIDNCIITEPIKHERTSGKNPHYYYVLKLRGHNLDFRFYDRYYKYSNNAWRVSELKEWDTVSIQIFTGNQKLFDNQYSTGEINLVNLSRHGSFLVDHKYRNASVKKSNKRFFYVLLAVFPGTILLNFSKKLYHIIKARKQSAISR